MLMIMWRWWCGGGGDAAEAWRAVAARRNTSSQRNSIMKRGAERQHTRKAAARGPQCCRRTFSACIDSREFLILSFGNWSVDRAGMLDAMV